MTILAFDPGESTGWVCRKNGFIEGGTVKKSFETIEYLFNSYRPQIVVYETFALYPSLAKSLAWNTMYPCEVIGVIKFLAEKHNIKWYDQPASCKKYAGKVSLKDVRGIEKTGHTKDALIHLQYFLTHGKGKDL